MKDNKAVQKTTGFIKEFKDFISKGNVIDLAVGVIIGGAFQKIINSLVNDIIMPLIGLAMKGTDFATKFIALDGGEYASIDEATAAGAAILTYGNFIAVILDFIIVAFVIFCMVKIINAVRAKAAKEEPVEEAAPTTKICPFCKSEIAIDATKCCHCTSDVE